MFLQGDRHTNITYNRRDKQWMMTSMRKMIEYEAGGREPEATEPVIATSKVSKQHREIETIMLIFSGKNRNITLGRT